MSTKITHLLKDQNQSGKFWKSNMQLRNQNASSFGNQILPRKSPKIFFSLIKGKISKSEKARQESKKGNFRSDTPRTR